MDQCQQDVHPNDHLSASVLESFGKEFGRLHGPLSIVVCAFGIVSNLINVAVLTRGPLARSSTHHLLIWLAAADLVTMLFYTPLLLHFNLLRSSPLNGTEYTTSSAWAMYKNLAISVTLLFHSLAVWVTVLLAAFRYVYIALPVCGPLWATRRRAFLASGVSALACSTLLIPNLMLNRISECQTTAGNATTVLFFIENINTTSSFYLKFKAANLWIHAITFRLLPMGLLAILTLMIVYQMRVAVRKRESLRGKTVNSRSVLQNLPQRLTSDDRCSMIRENRTTILLLTVVVSSLCIEVPQGVLLMCAHLIEGFENRVYNHLGDLLDFLALIGESVNFVIYTTMSQQFRQTFCNLFFNKCEKDRNYSVQEEMRLRQTRGSLSRTINGKTTRQALDCSSARALTTG